MRRDSVQNTLLVAVVLCVVCSVLVSAAAVGLRDMQNRNKRLDRQKNVLLAAKVLTSEEATPERVAESYQNLVEPLLVNLETGQPVSESEVEFEIGSYDQREASQKPSLSDPIPSEKDVAGIKRREKYAFVYQVKNDEGDVVQLVLPVYGKGLWSTLYGFLSLESDGNTVGGITFYEHKETPGLGGEIENANWQALWEGKSVYGDDGEVDLTVVKGKADPASPKAAYQIDGLSGATITAKGVSNLVEYWLGPEGFGTYLESIREPTGGSYGG